MYLFCERYHQSKPDGTYSLKSKNSPLIFPFIGDAQVYFLSVIYTMFAGTLKL